ncbi:MAG: arsinothricin resistance N-acetyltransferase ArsN1 family B [Alphaproteobacteria bacterium]
MIRLARTEDAAAIRAIYAPYVADTVITFETEIPGLEEMTDRIAKTMSYWPWLVEERDGAILGYAYASQHRSRAAYRWSVDVAIYVAPGAHRQGLGRSLYRPLFDILKAQRFRAAFAGITLPNAASVGLHEAMGFTPVGVYRDVGYKAGSWLDVGWWQLDLGAPHGAPPEPLPLAALDLPEYWV